MSFVEGEPGATPDDDPTVDLAAGERAAAGPGHGDRVTPVPDVSQPPAGLGSAAQAAGSGAADWAAAGVPVSHNGHAVPGAGQPGPAVWHAAPPAGYSAPPASYPDWVASGPGAVGGPAAPPAFPGPRPTGPRGLLATLPPIPVRTHRWGLGAYLLVEFTFLVFSALIGLFVVGDRPTDAGALTLALAVPTLAAAGLAVLITKIRGNGPREDLRLRWSWAEARLGLAFGFGGLFLTLPAAALYMTLVGSEATSAVGEVFGQVKASPVVAVTIFLVVVLVAPLCEEIVYRGLLWGAVERLHPARWTACGVTTVLFALAHFEFSRTPLLLLVALPIALARLYTGGLLASIIAHQVNNLLPGIALLLALLGVIPMV